MNDQQLEALAVKLRAVLRGTPRPEGQPPLPFFSGFTPEQERQIHAGASFEELGLPPEKHEMFLATRPAEGQWLYGPPWERRS